MTVSPSFLTSSGPVRSPATAVGIDAVLGALVGAGVRGTAIAVGAGGARVGDGTVVSVAPGDRDRTAVEVADDGAAVGWDEDAKSTSDPQATRTNARRLARNTVE